MTIHVDIDEKSIDEFLDEHKDALFNMLNNVGLLKPNKKGKIKMNSNWIELHENGKSVIINVDKITTIEQVNVGSYIYLSKGEGMQVDESYTSIMSKLGSNQGSN